MTAAEALALAKAHGVTILPDGDDLEILADREPDRDLLDAIAVCKAAILAKLREEASAAHHPLAEAIEAERPPDVTGNQWRIAMRGLRAFIAAGHGDEAERLGWPRDELFRVPPVWARVELCGAALLIGDREVLDVTRDAIRIKTASGAIQAFYRKPEPDFALIYSERRKLILRDVDPDEAHCRAYDYTISAYRAHHGCNLETAKAAVMAALKGEQRK
jgi:hypothetical protein